MVAPDGSPASFNGTAWVSQDGKYWWNGAAWQPMHRRRGPNLFVVGVGVLIAVAALLVITGVIRPAPSPPSPPVVMGVTHEKIDSASRIEFDYARSTPCNYMTLQVAFYDKSGLLVDNYVGSVGSVSGGAIHHYVFDTKQPIPQTAVRFVASPTCYDVKFT